MQQLIKFKKAETKNMLFLSDLHLGHDRDFIWGKRGFASSEEHDDFILGRLRDIVTEDTIIFNLGDIVFNDPNQERFKMISELPCAAHYLLWGNHNSGSLNTYRKARNACLSSIAGCDVESTTELYPLQHNNITFVGNDLTIRIGKLEIAMSHFPKHIWDHMGWGAWHLSGHSHGSDASRSVASDTGLCLDIGIEHALIWDDNPWFTYDDLKTIMDNKKVLIKDHHDDKTNPSR